MGKEGKVQFQYLRVQKKMLQVCALARYRNKVLWLQNIWVFLCSGTKFLNLRFWLTMVDILLSCISSREEIHTVISLLRAVFLTFFSSLLLDLSLSFSSISSFCCCYPYIIVLWPYCCLWFYDYSEMCFFSQSLFLIFKEKAWVAGLLSL